MAQLEKTKYTVVQHSGYGYGNNTQFMYGLESRSLTTDNQLNKVIKAGGMVFNTYSEAEDYADFASYPKDYNGLTPRANQFGSFSRMKIDKLRIFVPKLKVQLY